MRAYGIAFALAALTSIGAFLGDADAVIGASATVSDPTNFGLDPVAADPEFHGGPRFVGSWTCALCHSFSPDATAMRDRKGESVAPYDLWRATMMANASRDPLWRAVVSAEVATYPTRKAEIEDKCLRCHAPVLWFDARSRNELASMERLDAKSDAAELGMDGVTCTVCHQIQPDRLGTDASFGGAFSIGTDDKIYGPHADPFFQPMRNFTGYVATAATHVTRSALCATCHTLFTRAYDPEGKPTEHRLPEQTPYLEWRNSLYNDETPGVATGKTCQDCHVPKEDEVGRTLETRIVRNPGGFDFGRIQPRKPYGRHVFVGGNTLVPAVLRDHREEIGVEASDAELDKVIQAARRQLQERTARVDVRELERTGERVTFVVTVENLTGHKFPTGHPSRRAWLEVVVSDASGREVFVSGRADEEGRLLDGQRQRLASELVGGPTAPHLSLIERDDQVALFESAMEDVNGRPTYRLLGGARYRKDTRLLPAGWRADHPDAEFTRPIGVELGPDFAPGSVRVGYRVSLDDAVDPMTLSVALRYQTLGGRYAAELTAVATPEVARWQSFVKGRDLRGEVVDSRVVPLPTR